jgi:methylated-DNA-[protein]-cysteine S-methyltransferase
VIVETPVGPLALTASARGLERIDWEGHGGGDELVLEAAAAQLAEYFAGERTRFDLPLHLEGTEFQRLAWTALAEIPYGTTRSYTEQARRIGRPTAIRAVGAANGRNPLPIVLPCHRLVGVDGSLTGFGGGLWRKRLLLDLEAGQLARSR